MLNLQVFLSCKYSCVAASLCRKAVDVRMDIRCHKDAFKIFVIKLRSTLNRKKWQLPHILQMKKKNNNNNNNKNKKQTKK